MRDPRGAGPIQGPAARPRVPGRPEATSPAVRKGRRCRALPAVTAAGVGAPYQRNMPDGRLAPAVSRTRRRLDLHTHSAWSSCTLLRLRDALRRPADRPRARPAHRSQRPPSVRPTTTACPSSSDRGAAPSGTRCRRPPQPRSRPRGPVRPGPARAAGPPSQPSRMTAAGATPANPTAVRVVGARCPAGTMSSTAADSQQPIGTCTRTGCTGWPSGLPRSRSRTSPSGTERIPRWRTRIAGSATTDRSIRSRAVSHHVDAVSKAEVFLAFVEVSRA